MQEVGSMYSTILRGLSAEDFVSLVSSPASNLPEQVKFMLSSVRSEPVHIMSQDDFYPHRFAARMISDHLETSPTLQLNPLILDDDSGRTYRLHSQKSQPIQKLQQRVGLLAQLSGVNSYGGLSTIAFAGKDDLEMQLPRTALYVDIDVQLMLRNRMGPPRFCQDPLIVERQWRGQAQRGDSILPDLESRLWIDSRHGLNQRRVSVHVFFARASGPQYLSRAWTSWALRDRPHSTVDRVMLIGASLLGTFLRPVILFYRRSKSKRATQAWDARPEYSKTPFFQTR